MLNIRPITQSQFLVFTSLTPDLYFTTFTGVRDTSATSQYAHATQQRIYNLRGPKTLAEMTLSTPFDPEIHAALVDIWNGTDNCQYFTTTVTPVTCGENPQPIGRELIVFNCQWSSINFGAVDRSSGNPSTLEATIVGDYYTYL